MSSATYKFEANLLKLSESTDFTNAKKEWIRLPREEKGNKKCLCQHRIRNINYMFNTKTKRIIPIGKDCLKKFNFNSNVLTNSISVAVLNKYITNLGYEEIDDVEEYSKEIEELYLKSVIEKYESCKYKYSELLNLESEVKYLIELNFVNLRDIYIKITKQIYYLKQAELERLKILKIEQARKQAEDLERYKQLEMERQLAAVKLKELEQKELEKQAIELEIKRQQELAESKIKRECKCGIRFENICVCDVPTFELIKISKQNWCTKCNKWQDRCK